MRYPQLLIYENDGRLAEFLRREGKPRQWLLREPRRPETCLRLLRRGGPNAFILKVGNDVLQELTLLNRVSWLYPETASLVVGDMDNPVLAGLAWDLGAALVLFPPQPRHYLLDFLNRLLEPCPAGRAADLHQHENPVGRRPAGES